MTRLRSNLMLLLGWLASLCITVPLAVLLDRYVSRRYEMESWIPDRFRKRFFNETTYELTPLRQEYEYLFTTRAPVRVRSRRDPLCAVGRTFRYYIPDDLYEILSKLRSVLVLLDRDMRRTLDPTKACAKIVTTDYFKKISAIEQSRMFNDDRTVIIDLNDKNPPLTYHLKARWAVSNWVEPRMHPVYDVSIGLSPRNMTASLLPFMGPGTFDRQGYVKAAGGSAAFVTAHDAWKSNYTRVFEAMGPRRYLLTFYGTRYIDHEGAQRYDLRYLHDPHKGIVISLSCVSKTNEKDLARQPRFFFDCDEDARQRKNYSFLGTSSTIFGLAPAGRQPATYRLAELLLGGSIPILFLAEKTYRLPYALTIDWSGCALVVHSLYEVRRALLMDQEEIVRRLQRCHDIAQQHYRSLEAEVSTLFDELAVYFK